MLLCFLYAQMEGARGDKTYENVKYLGHHVLLASSSYLISLPLLLHPMMDNHTAIEVNIHPT